MCVGIQSATDGICCQKEVGLCRACGFKSSPVLLQSCQTGSFLGNTEEIISSLVILKRFCLPNPFKPFKVFLLTGDTSEFQQKSEVFTKALRFLLFQIAFILQFFAKNQRVELETPIISAQMMNLYMRSKYSLIFSWLL